MKKILIYLMLAVAASLLWACDDDDPGNTSIFPEGPENLSQMDQWTLENYTYPYNIELKYRMEDIESDIKYDLVPATVEKSLMLAKIIKHVWLEAYDEVVGIDFTRTYVPKMLHFIGSAAYNNNNTIVLGTAEGGLKITLYQVNETTADIATLNSNYLRTMHHEFSHILHQTKNYDIAFDKITGSDYIGDDWSEGEYNNQRLALSLGFITPYARKDANEDFVELIANYVTNTQATWDAWLNAAGATGRPILEEKFTIVRNYLKGSWNIDIDQLRAVVQRRSGELGNLDYTTY